MPHSKQYHEFMQKIMALPESQWIRHSPSLMIIRTQSPIGKRSYYEGKPVAIDKIHVKVEAVNGTSEEDAVKLADKIFDFLTSLG